MEKIIDMIDAYITQLESARTVLAGYRNDFNQSDQRAPRLRRKQKHIATKSAATPSTVNMVAVQVLPPKLRRNSRTSVRLGTTKHTALSGPVPQGPVVVRSAEVAQIKAMKKQSESAAASKVVPASGSILQELAQEVTRRLGRNGGSRLVLSRIHD